MILSVTAITLGATGAVVAAVGMRQQGQPLWWLWALAPPLAVVHLLVVHGTDFLRNCNSGRKRLSALEEEAVGFLEGLQAAFDAGLHLESAIRVQRDKARWTSDCGAAMDGFLSARAAGFSLPVAASVAMRSLAGTGTEATYLRMALACFAEGSSQGLALGRVAAAFAERVRAAQKMRQRAFALSAQVRFQAKVLLVAPLVLAAILAVLRPAQVAFFFETALGRVLLGLMVVLHCFAAYVLRRMQKSIGIGG